ncbi:MAG: hypothetical protein IT460_14125 [Planctomycetes bacterium]|nr:hypothetical protein [Planctomycetota bacterium]
MPRSAPIAAVFLALAGTALGVLAARRAPAADAPAKAPPVVETWEGYLWKDKDGRTRLGDPVIAMGVMATPAQVVAEPAASRLAPFLSPVGDEYHFWNYTLDKEGDKALDAQPRYLVRLRGPVTTVGERGGLGMFSSDTVLTMDDARLVTLEPVDRGWLDAWAVVFRDKASPWRIREGGDTSEAGRRRFAERALAALAAMRARPGPSDAERAAAKAADAGAALSDAFRRESEASLQRYVVAQAKANGWALRGLDALPPVPPDADEVQGLFLEHATKAAFLAAVVARWKGDLSIVLLPHYVETGPANARGVSWSSVSVAAVRDDWSDDDYVAHRRTTVATLRR